jgi:GcrA cell cycle regulator
MSWTDERIAELQRLWAEGKSASEIAAILGDVTRNAVIGKAHRLNLSGRPSPIKRTPRRGASILALTDRMCKWPVGDPRDRDFHFCGKPTQAGMPYCCDHAVQAYQPAAKKGRDEERRAGVA